MFKRQIETILGLDKSTRDQFCGVYAMDQLPRKRQRGLYVINMDDYDEPGSHWVAVCDDGTVEYMDSYGLPPFDLRCLKFVGSDFVYNTIPIQRQYSNACGFHCIYFLLNRARSVPANDIIATLSRTDGDFIVKNYIYTNYSIIFK